MGCPDEWDLGHTCSSASSQWITWDKSEGEVGFLRKMKSLLRETRGRALNRQNQYMVTPPTHLPPASQTPSHLSHLRYLLHSEIIFGSLQQGRPTCYLVHILIITWTFDMPSFLPRPWDLWEEANPHFLFYLKPRQCLTQESRKCLGMCVYMCIF